MGTLTVIHGYGKGKTTGAIGLVLRAVGEGKRVAIVQFDKGFDGANEHYAERHVLRALPGVAIEPTGCERILPDGTFRFGVKPPDLDEAARGMRLARGFIVRAEHNLVVLDEALAAVAYRLLRRPDVDMLVDLFERGGRRFDLVLTGHVVWARLASRADRVVEVKKVKHYFDRGLLARPGIEM